MSWASRGVRARGCELRPRPGIAPTHWTFTLVDVVGTTDRVNDQAAHRFSAMLYQQIFAGSTIGAAFKDARDTVDLYGWLDVFHPAGALDRVLAPRRS